MPLYKLYYCIAAWLFNDEATGGDAVDSSFTEINILQDTGAVQVARVVGGGPFADDCAEWAGSPSVCQLTKTEAAQVGLDLPYQQISIVLWVKHDGAWDVSGSYFEIFLCKENVATPETWRLFHDGTTRKFTFRYVDTAVASYQIESNGSHPADTWIHLCVTADLAAQELRMYVDNVEVTASPVACGADFIATNDVDFSVGNAADDDVTTRFNGQMDEIGIFNKVLTDVERRFIFEDGLSGGAFGLIHSRVDVIHVLGVPPDMLPVVTSRLATGNQLEPAVDCADLINPRVGVADILLKEVSCEE